MTAPLTPDQEARVREIAMEVVLAAANAQALNAANAAIDRYRVSAREVEGFLDAGLHRSVEAGPRDA